MARPIAKREDIERGVLEVVARKGLRGTTIQDIADAASVSPGLLYRYWKNRDDLATEVYRKHYVELVQSLTGVAASEPDVPGKLRAMVRGFLCYADEHPVALRFLLLSQHDLAAHVPPEFGVRALLQRLLADGMARGQLRHMDPDLAVQLVLGIVLQPAIGVTYGHLATPASSHLADILAALERTLFIPDGEAP